MPGAAITRTESAFASAGSGTSLYTLMFRAKSFHEKAG